MKKKELIMKIMETNMNLSLNNKIELASFLAIIKQRDKKFILKLKFCNAKRVKIKIEEYTKALEKVKRPPITLSKIPSIDLFFKLKTK